MKNRKGWLLASIAILMLVIAVIALNKNAVKVKHKKSSPYLPPVSVAALQSGDNRGVIQTFAEIKPRWDAALSAQVNGEILKITNQGFAGQVVRKGDLLIRIEDISYKANLREAEQALSEAQLNLLLEQNKSRRAQRDWQRSGINKAPSDLALNKPQLEVARKAVVTAMSRLDAAGNSLAHTEIRAPFSGMITHRHVSIGQTITEGEELIHIIDNKKLEVSVALSKKEWSLLAKNWKNQTASIRNTSGLEIARAIIKRGGGFLDPETRLYKIFLDVDTKHARHILPGDFIRVDLPGRLVKKSLKIPESALTRDGFIWAVDDKHRLRKFFVKVLFHIDDKVVIKTPAQKINGKQDTLHWQIATTPLASFIAGTVVKPILAGKA